MPFGKKTRVGGKWIRKYHATAHFFIRNKH